jgi:hypothetical protein
MVQLGVAVDNLQQHVGLLQTPKKEVETKKVPVKPKASNVLEKMLNFKPDEEEVSEYDKIRQRNIEERMKMFNEVTELLLFFNGVSVISSLLLV